MQIGTKDTALQVLIVAEIGNNHEGNFEVARRLVHEAAQAGADAVKFQTFRTELFVSSSDADRYARLKSFELRPAEFEKLAEFARQFGLLFISTPLDLPSADFLTPLVDAFKIASGDNTFFPLIQRVIESQKPLLISTGLCSGDEAERLASYVCAHLDSVSVESRLGLLHCVTSYPTPPEEANLLAIRDLAQRYSGTVGYSDHTIGIEAAVLAVAAGARIIEKHFTLDKNYSSFRDHQLSADPQDLRALVERIRAAEKMLGAPAKRRQACEQSIESLVRRSIVAAREVMAGQIVSREDLMWLRPGGGLSPGNEHLLLGKRARRRLERGTRLLPEDVE